MSFAPVYLLNRFMFRLTDFMSHWYIDGSRRFAHGYIDLLQSLDHALALRVTLHYFWRPLYGDYTIIGRILGVVFRTLRVLVALVVYAFISFFALILYVVWLSLPFLPLFFAYRSLA
jgi:hypothetical protein